MALFRSALGGKHRVEAIARVKARDWQNRDEMTALLEALSRFDDFKPDELFQLVGDSEPAVRQFGEWLLKEKLSVRGCGQLFQLIQSRPGRAQQVLLHAVVRARPDLALPELQELLRSQSSALAMKALEAIALLPPEQAGLEFVAILSHERKELRYQALLQVCGDPRLLSDPGIRQKLADLAEDEDDRIRFRVLDVLAESDPQEAVRVALGLLGSPDPAMQQRAIQVVSTALERLGDSEETEERLLHLLTDGSVSVREGVIEIMMCRPDKERILQKLLGFCAHVMGWMRDRTLLSLKRFGAQITPIVLRLMNDRDEDVRSVALQLITVLESPQAVPHIVKMLADDDWWMRMVAAETLGQIGDRRAVGPLCQGLKDPDSAMACLQALAKIGDPAALPAIVSCLSMDEVELRIDALDAMVRIGDARVLPVIDACIQEDPSAAVKERARNAKACLAHGVADPGASSMLLALEDGAAVELTPLEKLLVHVRKLGASDLHVVVEAPPTVRLNGQLRPLNNQPYSPKQSQALILGILAPRERRVLEQDQQLDFCHTIRGDGRFRANIYQERKGLCASFRVIPNQVPSLADIGLPPHLADLVNYHQGLIVVAGPSGSGKSTTLAALVDLFNEQKRHHILLLEDPIEFVHPEKDCLVNQRQVHKHTRGFAEALRGALRQDPDVIVVGEMRDPETVMLAIEASETGHLVIGTMNTTSAPKTVDRIIDNFPVGEQAQVRTMLSETLKVVISQSLMPDASGQGRVALFEIMNGSRPISNLIRDNKTYQIPGQMQIGASQGHQTVDGALSRLLKEHRVSPEQAWARAEKKASFEHLVSPEFLASQGGSAAPSGSEEGS